MSSKSTLCTAAVAAVIVLGLSSQSQAQWTVTNLHPAGAAESDALGVSGAQQVGYAMVGGVGRASLWSGTAASWVDLQPAGATTSIAYGTTGTQQVGYAVVGGVGRASLWSGTVASWVDLSPAGATQSVARGVYGSQQVGQALIGGVYRAGLWGGTAGSWVDLNPGGSPYSEAYGTSGTQQVGKVYAGGTFHASLWSGTAASWVDLHPVGATISVAEGVAGSQQVGASYLGGYRASLWFGTAASWVDLNPTGALGSYAYGTSGTHQVGYALVGGVDRASLWSGTAASWVDLSSFLPGSWSGTVARSIWSDGMATYVAGYGYNNATGRTEALLWTMPVPEPGTLAGLAGGLLLLVRRRCRSCSAMSQSASAPEAPVSKPEAGGKGGTGFRPATCLLALAAMLAMAPLAKAEIVYSNNLNPPGGWSIPHNLWPYEIGDHVTLGGMGRRLTGFGMRVHYGSGGAGVLQAILRVRHWDSGLGLPGAVIHQGSAQWNHGTSGFTLLWLDAGANGPTLPEDIVVSFEMVSGQSGTYSHAYTNPPTVGSSDPTRFYYNIGNGWVEDQGLPNSVMRNLSMVVEAVPEPSALAGLSLMCLGIFARGRTRRAD